MRTIRVSTSEFYAIMHGSQRALGHIKLPPEDKPIKVGEVIKLVDILAPTHAQNVEVLHMTKEFFTIQIVGTALVKLEVVTNEGFSAGELKEIPRKASPGSRLVLEGDVMVNVDYLHLDHYNNRNNLKPLSIMLKEEIGDLPEA